VNRIHPGRRIPLRALQANGMRECKAVLNDVLEGKSTANFLEGMGCPGGCVGGPRRLVPVEDGIASVNRYGEKASYRTPIDNPYVIELLRLLGFETVESLLEGENMFTRRFGVREPKVEDKHR
jgi:iron only hydrogenase large subunit-like protein